MKTFLFTILVVLCLVSCSEKCPKGMFILKGEVSNYDGEMAYLKYGKGRRAIIIDSASVSGGKFKFKDSLKEPRLLSIKFKGVDQSAYFFAEPSSLTMKFDAKGTKPATLTGSKNHLKYSEISKLIAPIEKELEIIIKEYYAARDAKDDVRKQAASDKYDSIDAKKNKIVITFIKSNSNSAVSGHFTSNVKNSVSFKELKEINNLLSDEVKALTYVKWLPKKVSILEPVQPGNIALDIKDKTPEGNDFSLSELRGKYVLVDFWASWCGPCRSFNPELVKIYNQYKNKNFEILGVSLDNKKERWLKAIKDDKLEWKHVSDLKGWKCVHSRKYGVSSIPHAMLVGPDGKIISYKLHGEELKSKLAELLK